MARLFTRLELQRRCTREDAAVVIDNVVYDVTRFLEHHPGGAEVLLDNAGRDASRCFRDVGHSEDAKLWRREYAVGEVVPADRWEKLSEPPAAPGPEDGGSLAGLLHAAAPPLLLAALAVLLYWWLFP